VPFGGKSYTIFEPGGTRKIFSLKPSDELPLYRVQTTQAGENRPPLEGGSTSGAERSVDRVFGGTWEAGRKTIIEVNRRLHFL